MYQEWFKEYERIINGEEQENKEKGAVKKVP